MTSLGMVEVAAGNTLKAKEILEIADERMYENKRARKKSRKSCKEFA